MNQLVQRNVTLPVAKYTSAELEQKLEVYRQNVPTMTWAGTAAFLGMSRELLDAYLAGQITSPYKDEIVELLQIHRTHIEAYLETVLSREKGSPAGAQFYLKSKFAWEDKVSIELSAKPQLSIIVENELGRLLAGRDADIADAEIIEDDDDSWLG